LAGLLIVGGMGRLPLVEESLRSYWPADKLWLYKPPDHAVVTGAAIYSYLKHRSGFNLSEPAADAYYVKLEDRFDPILPAKARAGGEKKRYELAAESDRLLLQIFSGEEPKNDQTLDDIAYTLVHQGAVLINLEKTYPEKTPVWVQMRYEDEGQEEQHDFTKVPWVLVWVGQEDKLLYRRRYDEFLQEGNHEKSI
jgi:hypothetical protein